MTVVLDTSVLIDHLRGRAEARELVARHATAGSVHGSELTRFEILSGMRVGEVEATRRLLGLLLWHPVDEGIAEQGGELARAWRRSHSGVDAVDFLIAATAMGLGATLLTLNVKHFPMFPDLTAPY